MAFNLLVAVAFFRCTGKRVISAEICVITSIRDDNLIRGNSRVMISSEQSVANL